MEFRDSNGLNTRFVASKGQGENSMSSILCRALAGQEYIAASPVPLFRCPQW